MQSFNYIAKVFKYFFPEERGLAVSQNFMLSEIRTVSKFNK